jgi:hypothetical protein
MLPDVSAMTRVWKTARLGVCKDAGEYRKALATAHISVSAWADDLIGKIQIAENERDVALVRVSTAQLGFTAAVRRDVIYERASSLGLERCPPEVGLRLRQDYSDQRSGEWLLMGMDPVVGSYSQLKFFVLERDDDGRLWLNAYWAISGHLWSPECQWVFALPPQAATHSDPE